MPYAAPAALLVTKIVPVFDTDRLPAVPVICAKMPEEPATRPASLPADVFGVTRIPPDNKMIVTFPEMLEPTTPALLSPLTEMASLLPIPMKTVPVVDLPDTPILFAPVVTFPD